MEEEKGPTPKEIFDKLDSEASSLNNPKEKETKLTNIRALHFLHVASQMDDLSSNLIKEMEIIYTRFMEEAQDIFTHEEWEAISPIVENIDKKIFPGESGESKTTKGPMPRID